MNPYRKTVAEINLTNFNSNLEIVLQLSGQNRFVCPMIKANAYGHGAVQVAKNISKNYKLPVGVALIEEALELREAGILEDILVFGGFDLTGAKKIVDAKLTPVVSQFEQLEILKNTITDSINIHLKFNTGMNRLGFLIEDSGKVIHFLKNNPKIKAVAIFSHLSSGHDVEVSLKQELILLEILNEFKNFGVFGHLYNSDAIMRLSKEKNEKYNWGFRPGIMLYGYGFKNNSLKPVMCFKSRIQQIQNIKKGESVSYNETWVASKNSMIGIAPVGYADGVSRRLSNKGFVYIDSQKAPIVGKVCMDFLMIDLSDIIIKKNTDVILFDDKFQGADKVAEYAETISYEVLTSVSNRVPRKYIGVPL